MYIQKNVYLSQYQLAVIYNTDVNLPPLGTGDLVCMLKNIYLFILTTKKSYGHKLSDYD